MALITGAGSGIGQVTAVELARRGVRAIALADIQQSGLDETRKFVAKEGAEVLAEVVDVSNVEQISRFFALTERRLGCPDIIHNNAGTICGEPIWPESPLEKMTQVVSVNLLGIIYGNRIGIEMMSKNGGGVIINTASIAGMVGAGSSIPYCASKAAVINLTLSLARTLGPEIRVNAVAPGFIEGDWLQQGLGEAYESVRSAKASGAVLGKVATPDDIASGILAMIMATHTTGHILPLDGGDTLGPRIVSGLK